jgi:hypothetical protein
MNEALKNPFLLFIAGLLAIWLAFKVLKTIVGLAGLAMVIFVVLFVINPRFRGIVQSFFASIFK